ncbi:hypothetical protein [Acanthopleuribacter pedis]|uniref:Uncharacterized protein n=1 Tax=Acanthopleuribacter pedis TaxID=442870 RepID=A0A8J7QEF2_9BACT|nr:hypothetical protein [Acanthopleuribacter pedis]MBO1319346.1 hypothetical protein [Acanthopleuribacter pedis]
MIEMLIVFAGLIGAATILPQAAPLFKGRSLDEATRGYLVIGFCSDLIWTFYSLKTLNPLLIFIFLTATLFRGLMLILSHAEEARIRVQAEVPVEHDVKDGAARA